MTKAVLVFVFASVLLFGLPPEPAEARWHLDIQAGAFIPTEHVSFNDDFVHFDIDPEVGGAFTIGGGYMLDRWIDFTGQFQTGSQFDLYDEAINVYSLTVGGRVFPLPMAAPFRPWLGAQIGWYHVDAYGDDYDPFDDDNDDHDGQDSFGLNAGGGFDIPVNPRVSLGLDVRYHNAFEAFQSFEFVTTMFNVSIWFGDEASHSTRTSDTPPVPRGY
jgi:hypothetical protein